jgi:(5-formylfuran-3-yl)methyl phosphate synthase
MNACVEPVVPRVLVSVRNVEEALLAARGGADFIDLKDPAAGALGGLPTGRIEAIVGALRSAGQPQKISATIGDLPMDRCTELLERVHAVAACGVDYVKVGVQPHANTGNVLTALAACGRAVVPVLLADAGLDAPLLAQACAGRHPAVMLDTADKLSGSLFEVLSLPALHGFVRQVQQSGALAGLAGALRGTHWPLLASLRPDFAGFRSAVCVGHRAAALDPRCLAELLACRDGAMAQVA